MINKSIKFFLALNAQEMNVNYCLGVAGKKDSSPRLPGFASSFHATLQRGREGHNCLPCQVGTLNPGVCVVVGAAPNLVSWRRLRVPCADFQTMFDPQPPLQSKERKAGVPLATGNLGNSGQRAVVLSGGPRHSINITWGLARDARSWATQSYGAPGQLSRCRYMC